MNWRSGWQGLARRVRCALAGVPLTGMLLGGGGCMLCGAVVRGLCGSPYRSVIYLRLGDRIPGPPVMTLLWAVWYALLGGAFAYAMLDRRCDPASAAVRYRGGMCYLSMLFLGFCWYPLFFVLGHSLLCALVLLAVLLLCLATVGIYWRVYRPVAWVLALHSVFLLWLWVLNVVLAFAG